MATLYKEDSILSFDSVEDLDVVLSKVEDTELRYMMTCLREAFIAGDVIFEDLYIELLPIEVKMLEGLLNA